MLLPVPGDRHRPQLVGLPSVGSRHAGHPSAPRQSFRPGEAFDAGHYPPPVRTEMLTIRTGGRPVVRDITGECAEFVAGERDGLLHVFVPHATAGLAIIETGAGSDDDLLAALDELLPADGPLAAPARQPRARARPRAARVRPAVRDAAGPRRPAAAGHLAVGLPGRHQRRQPHRQVRLSFLAG